MPNTLTLFKANCTLADSWLQAFDAHAVAVQGNLIITTPNMHFVPELHHFDGLRPTTMLFAMLFAFLERRHFHSLTHYIELGLPLPRMTSSPSLGIHFLWAYWLRIRSTDYNLSSNWRNNDSVITERPSRTEATLYTAVSCPSDYAVARLKSHPLTFHDLLIFITNAQHLFLDIYSYIDWMLIAHPLTTLGLRHDVHGEWMGGFIQSSNICEKLFCTGVPVWYVHASSYIPQNMKVIEPVLLTRPDHIIISMYAEGRKVPPFEVIYHGPNGCDRHVHIRCLYAGTTYLDPEVATPQPLSSSNHGPKSSTLGKVPSQQKGKQKHQPYSVEARPACPIQPGESRDKWKDPDMPYLPPPNLHWEGAMKIVTREQSRIHTPYIIYRGYRFPKPALLIGPKLPECLQVYLANWLASCAPWIGQVDHDSPCTYPTPQLWRDFLGSVPSAQPQSLKEKDPDRKGLMATEKRKQVMWDLFGDNLLETQGDIFSPEGVVEYWGEQIPVTTLANPPTLLAQKVTWELFELGFRYELRDLDQLLGTGRMEK
ncbi:uncharacterized protein F5891DRAFT_1189554 [Suillus fuscotomentosus]|uniref:Uncharacterized protein n=1 Tax=Suillus fuscotomentosus TaxID=1912939 RepID=A0AAD4HLD8_9AGAM|nr:uncharacterized protein F5891DRAFT_1189554 [Suillus fuscotomentosus]KAG1899744.1 hypothetical protein F5891DRAFT_1189554 [Suillus fuscotomentosus]